MRLQVIGTGSAGNCYVLHAGGSSLLLDAGVPIRQIVQHVENWDTLRGCLVTHEHKDHCKAVRDVMLRGVPVYMSKGTREAITPPALQGIGGAVSGFPFRIGDFTILPFEAQHDAREPLGFLIRYDPTGEKLLYATDTFYLKRTYPGVHYWLIECNYIDEIAVEQMLDGSITPELRGRLLKSHMSLRRLLELFKANDLTTARKIVLCHMSDQRSDERVMVEAVSRQTGVETVAAAEGMEIALDLCPF